MYSEENGHFIEYHPLEMVEMQENICQENVEVGVERPINTENYEYLRVDIKTEEAPQAQHQALPTQPPPELIERRPARRKYEMKSRAPAATYFCILCNKNIKYPSKINEHMRKHTGERPYCCYICGNRFSQGHVLKSHLRSHQGEKPYKCSYCERSFASATHRNTHEKQQHSEIDPNGILNPGPSHEIQVYICPFQECGMQSQIRSEVEEHLNIAHPPVEVVEEQWSEEYMDDPNGIPQDQTTFHEQYHYQPGDVLHFQDADEIPSTSLAGANHEVYEAKYEQAPFDDVPQSIEEVEVETSQDQTIDDYQLGYQVEDQITSEQLNALNGNIMEEEEYKYKDFNHVNVQEQELEDYYGEEHVRVLIDPDPAKRVTPGEKELQEVVVDARLIEMCAPKVASPKRKRRPVKPARNLDWIIDAVSKGLDVDMVSPHNRRKPKVHVCEYCGKVDKYPSKILAHMRTHTGEKPYKCDICGMCFSQRTPLRLHMRRHLNQKPYHCNFENCQEAFISGALLNLHVTRKHLQKKKYVCMKGCGRYFASAKNQRHHEASCNYNSEEAEEMVYQQLLYDQQEANYVVDGLVVDDEIPEDAVYLEEELNEEYRQMPEYIEDDDRIQHHSFISNSL